MIPVPVGAPAITLQPQYCFFAPFGSEDHTLLDILIFEVVNDLFLARKCSHAHLNST